MSDEAVLEVIGELDRWLREAPEAVEAERVAAWRGRFDSAVSGAERGPSWEGVVAYAHEVEGRLNAHLSRLLAERADLKARLESQALGERALRAYKPAGE